MSSECFALVLSFVFITLSTLAITVTYKKGLGFIASSTVPPIDLDLAQVFPFGVPTVLFEMWLLNPRIGDFAGRLKGDVVTAQCVENFGVHFQGAPIWPEDVRDCGNKLFHGPSSPHWLRVDPVPSLGLVRIGEQGFHTVNDRVQLLELLFLRQLASDERTEWR